MADVPVSTSLPSEMRARPIDPFRWLRSEVDRIFEDFDSPKRLFAWGAGAAQFPQLDMREDKDGYKMTIELAGYDKDQIDISVEDGFLVLKGRRSEQNERTESGFLINERQHGEFERRVAMPRRVEPAKIRATLDKGLLQIEIPRVPDPEARKIEIQSGSQTTTASA